MKEFKTSLSRIHTLITSDLFVKANNALVEHIIHFDVPYNYEDYNERLGEIIKSKQRHISFMIV